MTTATDLSAKLLATENITVTRGAVKTASFDIKQRVLTIPLWKNMTPEIEDMLISHEVAHALYTEESSYGETVKSKPYLKGYMNVLEDVRIEKLIKRKYPGLRKRMAEGYRQLNEQNFFGINDEVNENILIDRINLWFKVGLKSGVTFDSIERNFIKRAENLETIPQVISLAEDIFVWAKAKRDEEKEQMEKELADALASGEIEEDAEEDFDVDGWNEFDEEDEFEDWNETIEEADAGDGDESEDEQNAGSGQTNNTNHSQAANTPVNVNPEETYEDLPEDFDIQPKTQKVFDDKLEETSDTNTVFKNWIVAPKFDDSVVIGYKEIVAKSDIEKFRLGYDDHNQRMDSEFETFYRDSQREVAYLVKEFELRKSASQLKRAQTAKMGSLDMRKIYGYKVKDDLFKRVTMLPEGKNHCMLILVDWSGSMDRIIRDTLKQVINLAMFCNRAQIPYRVLAFTNSWRYSNSQVEARNEKIRALRDWSDANPTVNALNYNFQFNLLELLSSKMSTTEFNTMIRRMCDYRFFWNRGFNLSQTPLNEALLWVYENMGAYIAETGAEKSSLVVLSDGAGSRIEGVHRYIQTREWGQGDQVVKVKNSFVDPKTKKTYELSSDSCAQTIMLNKMIKDHWGTTTIGYYICDNTIGSLREAIQVNRNVSYVQVHSDLATKLSDIRGSFKTDGYYSMKGTGRDEFFLVPKNRQRIVETSLSADKNMTAARLARNFSKFLNTKKSSRVLLNRFVDLIA